MLGLKRKTLETVEQNVRNILEKYPETRNNDLLLILCYLRYVVRLKCYGSRRPHKLWIRDADVNRLKSLEGIRRVRQKIVKKHPELLPTDPNVIKRRNGAEKMFQEYAREGEDEG